MASECHWYLGGTVIEQPAQSDHGPKTSNFMFHVTIAIEIVPDAASTEKNEA